MTFSQQGILFTWYLKRKTFELTDIAKTAEFMYRNSQDFSFAENAAHYKRMIEIEQFEDLKYCFKKDIIRVVPKYKDGIIKL